MHSNDPYASGEGGGSRGGAVVWACRQVLIWGGLAAALYLAIGYRSLVLPSGQPPASSSAAVRRDTAAPAPADANTNTQTYHADRNGHVVLEAAVNGAPVRFLSIPARRWSP